MNHRNVQKMLALSLIFLLVAACGGRQSLTANDVPVAAPPLPPTPPPQEGSLWNARQPNGIIADLRALQVGDLVTVSITEAAKASEIANTQTSKDSGVQVSLGSLFGLSYPLNTFNDNTAQTQTLVDASTGLTSQGQGKTERQSTFVSHLTCRVIQVLPNNNLVIQGRRHLRINNETEVVTLTGIIRPQDVDRNNIVDSHKVAEPRVEISGVGVVSDKQRVGWLQRLFDHLWPF
jgi:flagellar L-ring protein precursor FlgH